MINKFQLFWINIIKYWNKMFVKSDDGHSKHYYMNVAECSNYDSREDMYLAEWDKAKTDGES